MAVTRVITCDGCSKRVDENTLGRKVVVACDNQFPPSVFFDYCTICNVPQIKDLARMKPRHLFQSIEVLTKKGWQTLWEGNLVYEPENKCFSDGGEKVFREDEL